MVAINPNAERNTLTASPSEALNEKLAASPI